MLTLRNTLTGVAKMRERAKEKAKVQLQEMKQGAAELEERK